MAILPPMSFSLLALRIHPSAKLILFLCVLNLALKCLLLTEGFSFQWRFGEGFASNEGFLAMWKFTALGVTVPCLARNLFSTF